MKSKQTSNTLLIHDLYFKFIAGSGAAPSGGAAAAGKIQKIIKLCNIRH